MRCSKNRWREKREHCREFLEVKEFIMFISKTNGTTNSNQLLIFLPNLAAKNV